MPGPDGLLAEHLKAGGEAVMIWLRNILNATVEVESVPTVLKRGVVLLVYKGDGKDSMKVDSYRGIKRSVISSTGANRGGFYGGWPITHQSVCLQTCSLL